MVVHLWSFYFQWAQFFSDFGGNVGLWVGASIFTILEFIELFSKICMSKVVRTGKGFGIGRGTIRRCLKEKDTMHKNNSSKKNTASNAKISRLEEEETV